jgi:O-antigen chain-terminating methyltransferase
VAGWWYNSAVTGIRKTAAEKDETTMDEQVPRDNELAGTLRQVREQVRARAGGEGPAERLAQMERELLYGDRDVAMLPELRVSLEEVNRLWSVEEQPFASGIPLLGRLISLFRELWNRVSTKWYVLAILRQQVGFNAAATRTLNNLHKYLTVSTMGIVRRMDALAQVQEERRAVLEARWQDQQAQVAHDWQEAHTRLEKAWQEAVADHGRLEAQVGRLEVQVRRLEEEKNGLAVRLDQAISALRAREEESRRGFALQRLWLERLMLRLAGHPEELPPQGPVAPLEMVEALSDHDYFAFENAFRGPESEVRARQEVYLDLFRSRTPVLDIGCGRGEFLELLREHGVPSYGIEINEQMLLVSRDKGLDVRHEDVYAHLAGLANGSLGGIFAGQVVEHLPTARLSDLARLAFQKLQPGAYLVAETPNPLCLWTMTQHFYVDMSHTRPLHPRALAFLFEMAGFDKVEVRFLNPTPEAERLLLPAWPGEEGQEAFQQLRENFDRLNRLLYGYQDFAIVARK